VAERTLLIGLGNLDRRDDGLGWFALNHVRQSLGLPQLDAYEDGLDDLGHGLDSIFVPLLAPELAELAAGYERVVIIDARYSGPPGLLCERVTVDSESGARLLSHDMFPAELVAMTAALYGRSPEVFVVSALGSDFDFGVGLSPGLEALLPMAASTVLELIVSA
jgi:hydrogenase maturation protease